MARGRARREKGVTKEGEGREGAKEGEGSEGARDGEGSEGASKEGEGSEGARERGRKWRGGEQGGRREREGAVGGCGVRVCVRLESSGLGAGVTWRVRSGVRGRTAGAG
jgi:hypothetical protein